MSAPSDGVYQIFFTGNQLLVPLDDSPDAPVVLLSPHGRAGSPEWQVRCEDDGTYTLHHSGTERYLGFEGEPDVYELAGLFPEPRGWQLTACAEPDSYSIGVPGTKLRLGMSPLRIFPPRVALAPNLGDEYQAWTFKEVSY